MAWARAAPALLGLALNLSGCVTLPGCGDRVGTPLLQCLADLGDKEAQFALGRAYEEGAGVPRDYRRAAKLYRAAASPTSGIIYVYSPGVGEAPSQVMPLRSGPDRPGLAQAARGLARLYERGLGVEPDPEKAALWRRRAGD